MAWTPPSDAAEASATSETTSGTGWTPPSDAVVASGWTPPADAVTGTKAEEKPGFFGQLKKSFMEVGVPQVQAGLTGFTAVAQSGQIAKTADKLKALEAEGKGDSKEAAGLRKTLDFYTKRQGTYFQDLAETQAKLQKAPVYAGVRKLSEAKTFSEGFKAFADDPVNIVANLTAQSLPTAVPGLIMGVINPVLGAATMGGSSFGVEFGGSLLEFAQEKGFDTSDPKQMAAFFANKDLLREGVNKAGARAGIIGAGDLFLAGLASKTLVPKRITGPVAKNVTNVGAQMGAQAVGGGGFEAAAQVATEGKVTKPGEVIAEGVGGLGTAPLEVYTQTREAAREIKKAKEAGAAKPAPTKKAAAPIPTDPASQLALKLEAQGFPAAEARKIAEARLAPKEPEGETEADREARLEREAIQAENEPIDFVPPADAVVSEPAAETTTEVPTLESLTGEFIDQGLTEEEARVQAQLVLDRAKPIVTTPPTPPSTIRTEAAPTEASVTQEMLDQGYSEEEAKVLARLYMMRQEGQVAPIEGEGRAARPDTTADRRGAEVSAPATDELSTAERLEGVERDGVVPAGQDVGAVAEREVKEPVAVSTEADYQAKKAKAQDIARRNAITAFDQVGEYADLDEALDSYRTNMADTLAEEGLRNDPDYDSLLAAAERAFDAEVSKQRGEPLGTETTETVQAEAQGQEAPAAPAVTGKKRGRPAALTPEEKAQREQERKADRAERGRHERALNKAEASLKKAVEPLDEGEFANEAELKEAQDDQRAERRNAIKELLKVSEESGLRPEGKRARQVLKDAGVPQTEIDDIKRGLERAKKALADKTNLLGPVSAKGAASTKADPAFSATKTGAQAIAHIIRTGNAFQKAFAQRIRNFVGDVRVVVLEKGDPIPEQLQTARNAEHWEKSRALYIENFKTGDRVIYVRGASFGNSQGANNITMLHELWHAATVKKIALAQKFIEDGVNLDSPLVAAYNRLLDTMHAAQERFIELNDEGMLPAEIVELARSTDLSIITDPREFVAYGMTDKEFQEFLMQAEGQIDEPNLFTRFVDSLRRMFGMPTSTMNAMSDLLIASDSLLRARTPANVSLEGEAAAEQTTPTPEEEQKAERTAEELAKDVAEAKRKVAESRAGEEARGMNLMQAARDPKKVLELLKNLWTGASYTQRQVMVTIPTMDMLADWTKDSIPRIGDIHRHMQEMNGMSLKFLEGSQQVIDGIRKVFKELPQERTKLENLVYESTLAKYDPADPTATVRNPSLDKDFNSLSPASQDAYRMLRDYYEDVHDLFRLLLDQQVENLKDVSADIKQNLMVMIRQSFETGDRIKPFFPLVRRGDYWVSVGKGPSRQFFMFEKMGERDAFAKTLKGDVRTGNDIGELRQHTQDASGMLKAFFDAIDGQDLTDPNVKEELKDAVYQIYLQTMPEQSFRKMFIHRKGISGFSTDLVRNTASTASRMSTQLAKLKYAPILRNDLSAARDSIAERPELTPFVQEAQRRVSSALSGAPGGLSEAIAGMANKASYLWYMSSASSALIQPFSIYISGLPVLAANHGGNWAGAARELGKMMTFMNQYGITKRNADGTLSYTSPSLANNTSLPEDERQAVREMMERGVQESTYASQVWGYARVPSADIDSVVGKGKRAADILIGGLMHNTERLTREAVYLASYRLGKKRGLSTEEAIAQAVADTNEALGDYDISNRPRWMQKGLGKIAFQFKMYPLHMTLLSLTSFKRMLPFLNKEGKLAAAQKFFGLMATSAMLAGVSNMLFFSPIMSLIGWAWKELQDDDEWPEELKDKSMETWFRTVFLPEHFGDITLGGVALSDLIDRGPLNALTGWDISSRIGLNDLWGRDMKEMKTARDSFTAWVIDTFGGPTVSLGLGMIDAYEAFAMGDYQKGIEKATPSVIRNLIIANKYADEGVKTARGSELVAKEALSKGELFGQAIGFRPDRAAYAQEQAFKLMGIEQKVLNQRDQLMRKLNIAERTGNDENFDRILDEEVTKFNAKNPEYKIEADDIRKSLKKQIELRESAEAGVNLTKKNVRLMGDALDNVAKQLEK